MDNGMGWDRRPSVPGAAPTTLPSLANITHASPGSIKSPSQNGNSPPLSQQSGDPRDSGNWSLNSARASNTSEPPFSPQLTLPPIEQHGASRLDSNNPTFSYNNNHSPTNSTFAASTISLQNTSPGAPYAAADALPTPSPSASRRSSFDSRLGNLNLSSPINGTPAASQVSLASTLQRERGIHSDSPAPLRQETGNLMDSSNNSSVTNLNPYGGIRRFGPATEGSNGYNAATGKPNPPQRTAPPIIGAPRFPYGNGPHPNAPSPTKGFPYAFPDPDFAGPIPRDSREGLPGRNSTSSLVSGASSIYSTNSSMLHPNHLENGSGPFTASGHFGQPPNGHHHHHHHHHHLQTAVRKVSVANGDSASPPATPYSRTPELRVSHKLAERKRRKEMKDLFDELRDQLPAERGGKSSKWEVLTKAIEFISQLKKNQETLIHNQETLQRELEVLRSEAQTYMAMRNEIDNLRLVQPATQNYHQSAAYHPQTHHQGHGIGASGRMQGIERC